MSLIIRFVLNVAAVLVTAYLLAGVSIDTLTTAILVALVLAVVNTILRPIILLITLPLTFITLGLFTFVVNALLVLLVEYLVPGFTVDGFLWALLFSLVLAIVSGLLHILIPKK